MPAAAAHFGAPPAAGCGRESMCFPIPEAEVVFSLIDIDIGADVFVPMNPEAPERNQYRATGLVRASAQSGLESISRWRLFMIGRRDSRLPEFCL
jgi:hypothetical protein